MNKSTEHSGTDAGPTRSGRTSMRRPPLRARLSHASECLAWRLIFALTISLILVLGIGGLVSLQLQRNHLDALLEDHVISMGETILSSVHSSMLTNDQEDLREIIENIGDQEPVLALRLMDALGEVRHSSQIQEVGLTKDLESAPCAGCHAGAVVRTPTTLREGLQIYPLPSGETALGLGVPILNSPECSSSGCHASPKEQSVLGMLDIEVSTARVEAVMAASRRNTAAFGILTILFACLVIGILLWRMVHRPLHSILDTTRRLGTGDLSHRVESRPVGELGELADSMNDMSAKLEIARDNLEAWGHRLEDRVAEKTRELERARDQMIFAGKMASLGKLAAIVAHEINNPLAGILVYTKLVRKHIAKMIQAAAGEGDPEEAKPRPELDSHLAMMERETARCGDIVRNLLLFSRRKEAAMESIDLNTVVEHAYRLVGHQADLQEITPVIDLDPVSKVICDPGQIEQACLAVIMNAIEAMPDGGTLEVRTRDLKGKGVRIEVADTGVGIPQEVRDSVFEPFFSTKIEGKGTGLGLSVMYGIIQRHGGTVEFDSEPGRGTTFRIDLPSTPPPDLDESDRNLAISPRAEKPAELRGVVPDGNHGEGLEVMTKPETQTLRILVVDDEQIVRESLDNWFREDGHEVRAAADAQEALTALKESSWDMALVDIKMPGMDGLSLLARMQEVSPDTTVIIMTAFASVETAVRALKEGAHDYVTKPFDPEYLSHLIRKTAEQRNLTKENRDLKETLADVVKPPGIIGSSPAIQRVREFIKTVAPTDTTVLISGESGTGKELIARAIHAGSPRGYMPMVVVNCGALPEGILESELFGHEKGAFTGAQYRHKGKFELADGGTLFLDEIADISTRIQVELLRVLEDKRVTRLGSSRTVRADFRTVAASNKVLKDEVAAGRFREDLFYRLNVFAIHAPALRDRPGDIRELTQAFVDRLARSMNRPVPDIQSGAFRLLESYDWPGNVRELANAIERAMVVRRDGPIRPEDLPVRPPEVGAARRSASAGARSLAEVERDHIAEVLRETEWNISKAARILGVDRSTVYHKIKQHKLKD